MPGYEWNGQNIRKRKEKLTQTSISQKKNFFFLMGIFEKLIAINFLEFLKFYEKNINNEIWRMKKKQYLESFFFWIIYSQKWDAYIFELLLVYIGRRETLL